MKKSDLFFILLLLFMFLVVMYNFGYIYSKKYYQDKDMTEEFLKDGKDIISKVNYFERTMFNEIIIIDKNNKKTSIYLNGIYFCAYPFYFDNSDKVPSLKFFTSAIESEGKAKVYKEVLNCFSSYEKLIKIQEERDLEKKKKKEKEEFNLKEPFKKIDKN